LGHANGELRPGEVYATYLHFFLILCIYFSQVHTMTMHIKS
jgi:hypothetical protein